MNIQEHLLVCLAEECAEVQHAIGKILRFGLEYTGPEAKLTNRLQLYEELIDVASIVKMLREEGVNIPAIGFSAGKIERTTAHIGYARLLGTIQ